VSSSPQALVRTALLLVAAMAVQSGLFGRNPIASVEVDVFIVIAIAGGVLGGAHRGVVMGFLAGCTADLLLHTPFGLSALTYALVGYAIGSIAAGRIRQSHVFPVVSGLFGGAFGMLGFAVVGELVGQPYLSDPDLAAIVLVRAAGAAVLAVPVTAALRWCWRPPIEGRMVIA
jgi:rod shape-determining protein MreD